MRAFVSSTIRSSSDPQQSGGLVHFDLDAKRILRSVGMFPAPHCARNPNPRGGSRGWRGIVRYGDSVVVANNDALVFWDRSLDGVRKVVTHPAFANLHGVAEDDGGLLVALTGTDSWAQVKPNLDVVVTPPDRFPRELIEILTGRIPNCSLPSLDRFRDYREVWTQDAVHLNYVRRLSTGRLIAIFALLDLVVELEPQVRVLYGPQDAETHMIAARDGDSFDAGERLSAPHDVVEVAPDEILINSSASRSLFRLNCATGDLNIIWKSDIVDRGWHRGLDVFEGNAYIGTGRGSLVVVDLASPRELDEIEVLPSSIPEESHSIFSVLIDR